jgi:hypothetical protein
MRCQVAVLADLQSTANRELGAIPRRPGRCKRIEIFFAGFAILYSPYAIVS